MSLCCTVACYLSILCAVVIGREGPWLLVGLDIGQPFNLILTETKQLSLITLFCGLDFETQALFAVY